MVHMGDTRTLKGLGKPYMGGQPPEASLEATRFGGLGL